MCLNLPQDSRKTVSPCRGLSAWSLREAFKGIKRNRFSWGWIKSTTAHNGPLKKKKEWHYTGLHVSVKIPKHSLAHPCTQFLECITPGVPWVLNVKCSAVFVGGVILGNYLLFLFVKQPFCLYGVKTCDFYIKQGITDCKVNPCRQSILKLKITSEFNSSIFHSNAICLLRMISQNVPVWE